MAACGGTTNKPGPSERDPGTYCGGGQCVTPPWQATYGDHGETTTVPIVRTNRTPVSGHFVVRVVLEGGSTLEISALHPTADGDRSRNGVGPMVRTYLRPLAQVAQFTSTPP